MSGEIERFQCVGPDEEHEGPFFDNYTEAKKYAQEHALAVIAYLYTFEDTELIDDFRPKDDDENEQEADRADVG